MESKNKTRVTQWKSNQPTHNYIGESFESGRITIIYAETTFVSVVIEGEDGGWDVVDSVFRRRCDQQITVIEVIKINSNDDMSVARKEGQQVTNPGL